MVKVDLDALIEQAACEVETVTVAEAAQRHAKGAQFVDVREPQEWLGGYIADTLLIPRGNLEFAIGDRVCNLNRHLIVYCESGERATLAAAQLKRLGFRNVAAMVDGGYKEWAAADYPTAHNPFKPLLEQ
jgi:rhodanese-related sulfurtransferase